MARFIDLTQLTSAKRDAKLSPLYPFGYFFNQEVNTC